MVRGETPAPREPTEPAAEGESGESCLRDEAARDDAAEGLRLAVDVSEKNAGLGADCLVREVDVDALHVRDVDHDTIVDKGGAADVVTTRADRKRKPGLTGVVDRVDDVRCARAAHHRGRPLVDAGIPD